MKYTSDFVIENGVLTKYVGPGGDVIIPAGVTSIGESAFYKCESLTGITIPDSMTSIGEKVFSYCSRLTNVMIPNGVMSIGEKAFCACSSLTRVTIPDGVKSIGDGAFCACYGLESVTIPDGVMSIGEKAFSSCKSLKSVTIPNGVTSIGREAFSSCDNLTSITIPDSVTSIGKEAFWHCPGLTSVTIPDSVTSIGSGAFRGCMGLTSVTIGNGVTSIGWYAFDETAVFQDNSHWENGVLYIDKHLIKAQDSLSGVYTIKNGTRCISRGAFSNCKSLMELIIPDGVKGIGNGAFSRCNSLTSITIPKTVQLIEDDAFPSEWYANPSKLKEIIVDSANPYYASINGVLYNKSVTELVAFPVDSPLTDLVVPDTVELIHSHAFTGSRNLLSVTLPDHLVRIGEYAFHDSRSLTSINLNHVQEIGKGAFEGCQKLVAVELDSLHTVEESTFQGCWDLNTLSLGYVESIGGSAFGQCHHIKNLVLPESLKTVGDYAFSISDSVEIPKTVISVGECSFGSSPAITIFDNLRGKISDIGKGYGVDTRFSYIVFVKSASDGKLKFAVPMYCDATWNMYNLLHKSWNNDNSFDFNSFDQYFKSIKKPDIKLCVAVTRLLSPYELSEEAKKAYLTYLQRNAVEVVKQLLDNKPSNMSIIPVFKAFQPYVKESVFELIENWGLLKKTNIDELFEYAQKKEAIEWLAFLMNWKNKNAGQTKKLPVIKQQSYDVGDTITFGQYKYNGKTVPMEWIVVDTTKQQYLLLSKYLVKEMPFYSKKTVRYEAIGWSASDVRTWLNGTFLSTAFDESERSRICMKTLKNVDDIDTEDRVFIPSVKEFDKYLFCKESRISFLYGAAGTYGYTEMTRKTWLRYGTNCVECRECSIWNGKPTYGGGISGNLKTNYYIRPMMWITKD